MVHLGYPAMVHLGYPAMVHPGYTTTLGTPVHPCTVLFSATEVCYGLKKGSA